MADKKPSMYKTPEEQRFETLLKDPDIVCFVNKAAMVTREHFDITNNPVGRFEMFANFNLMKWYGLDNAQKMMKSGNWKIPHVFTQGIEELQETYENLTPEQKEKLREAVKLSGEVADADGLKNYANQHPDVVEPVIMAMLDGIEKKKTPDCPSR